jgi:hypothetical protein
MVKHVSMYPNFLKLVPMKCIDEEDYQNLGMTNMKISIGFWWKTGHHFSSSCLQMFF